MTKIKVSCAEQPEALKCKKEEKQFIMGLQASIVHRGALRLSHGLLQMGQCLSYSTRGSCPRVCPGSRHISAACACSLGRGSAGMCWKECLLALDSSPPLLSPAEPPGFTTHPATLAGNRAMFPTRP